MNVALLALSYLVGSTPTSYLIGKHFHGLDLREHGSGNLGATNTFRVLGPRWAFPVLVVDVAKGFLPVALFAGLSGAAFGWRLAYGAAAIAGHMFSVWVGFRGGKGIATSTGVFLALAPWALVGGLVVWLALTFGTGYVSVGSIGAAVVLPALIALTPHEGGGALIWFAAALAAVVIWAHRANLGRLARGEESRVRVGVGRKGPSEPLQASRTEQATQGPTRSPVPAATGEVSSAEPARAAVIGAGAWGSALAMVLARNGHDVRIWSYEADVAQSINERRTNRYLEGVRLPEGIRADTDLEATVRGADLVVSATPSHFVRGVMRSVAPHLDARALVLSATKGLELGSLLRMDQVLTEILPDSLMRRFCVLSGPSFAHEVASGAPTAVVVGSHDSAAASDAAGLFQTDTFRVYTNADVVGVELGGALKNVIALAAGVTDGLGYGHNTLAALITRGLAEMTRLGLAVGAERTTFYGLAGLGDLVLTCTGSLSRNRSVGYRLGRGEALEDVLGDMTAVAEGVKTTEAARQLALRHGVEMPITEQIYAILYEGRRPEEALRALMSREPKPEDWS